MNAMLEMPSKETRATPPVKTAKPQEPSEANVSISDRLGVYLFAAAVLFATYVGWREREEEHLTAEHGLGYALGIVGSVMMLVLVIYPLRKRARFMRDWGSTARWYRVHMIMGIVGPLLILYHANFSLGSLNSNVALIAMLLVVASGFIGRYIYTKIHHGLNDQRIDLEQLRAETELKRRELGLEIALGDDVQEQLTRLEKEATAVHASLWRDTRRTLSLGIDTRLARFSLRRQIALRMREAALLQHWNWRVRRAHQKAAFRFLNAYLGSVRKIAAYGYFARLFALWHVAHMPLFFLLIFAAIAHVFAVHMY